MPYSAILFSRQNAKTSRMQNSFSNVKKYRNILLYNGIRSFASEATKTVSIKRNQIRMVNLDIVHENYSLFRKGQDIGFRSTIMEDPLDAYEIKEDNYSELKFYFGIPKLAEKVKEGSIKVKVSKRTKVNNNSPSGSWMQVVYPFAENQDLAYQYKKFTVDELIFGKILEEIDALCAETASRFIRGSNEDVSDVSTVTAAVDQLNFDSILSHEENLKINCYVIYAGSTTIYVKTDLYSQKPGDDTWRFRGYIIFIMAARRIEHSFKVPTLEFKGEDDEANCKTREILGRELKDYIMNLNNNLYRQPPNKEESSLIHSQFKRLKFDKSFENVDLMSNTKIEHTMVMSRQEQNTYGKIFGGYLMNKALEVAFLATRRFSEELNPIIFHMDAVKFIKPVEVGNLIQFRSRITYTKGNIVRVNVTALNKTDREVEGDTTNEFHFVFKLNRNAKEIIPESYFDALLYLEGKRRTEYLLSY